MTNQRSSFKTSLSSLEKNQPRKRQHFGGFLSKTQRRRRKKKKLLKIYIYIYIKEAKLPIFFFFWPFVGGLFGLLLTQPHLLTLWYCLKSKHILAHSRLFFWPIVSLLKFIAHLQSPLPIASRHHCDLQQNKKKKSNS
jgi:hypothetical protein